MKTVMMIGAAMMAMAGSAEAACSTASMAGNWRMVGQDNVCAVTLSAAGVISGVSCSDGLKYTGTITLSSSCVLNGTISGIAIKGRTNPLTPSSSAVPTLVTAASVNGKIAFTGFRL